MLVSRVQPVMIRNAEFCIVWRLLIAVWEAMGDHIVDAYSSTGLMIAL